MATGNHEPRTTDKLIWILLTIAVIFIYFFGLSIPLLGPDEARYAQVAREMFERGEWITPTLGGFHWFEKPALLYWLQIASYKIFGVTEFAARFGSALFGLGTIFCLWILGKFSAAKSAEKTGENAKTEVQRPETDFANWLALIAASSIGLLAFSRGASFDIILTFPITASLVSFFIWETSRAPRYNGTHGKNNFSKNFARPATLISFYFFIGVALLAKGLVGIIFPLATVALYYLLSFKLPGRAFFFSLFWGTTLCLLVASVWYLPMYQAHGWTFIDEFFLQHHFQRYTSNKYQHPQPFWFFWFVLPLMTIPWLPFFLASIRNPVRNIFYRKNAAAAAEENQKLSAQRSALNTFAFAWLLVPVVFFSLSGSKLPGYVLPVLPAALILTADYVARFVRKSKRRAIVLQVAAFLMFAVVFVILQFFIDAYPQRETVKNLIVTANSQGFGDAKILMLHTISHNAEFYGAGRLVRRPDGKQRYLYGVAEVREFIEQNGNEPVLVLVPLEYLNDLTASDLVSSKILADNGELAIAAATARETMNAE
ncbi:MAG: glycosyltransferase family 39 protein [Acidobacteriota bacterium]|nr:glycosyltransferase family 39 protein [Acidobacteriota bacterium]